MTRLSKSRLLDLRQCERKIWLEVFRGDLKKEIDQSESSFETGHHVGDIARQIYDPPKSGRVFEPKREGYDYVVEITKKLLEVPKPIFEAGFFGDDVLIFADAILPVYTSTGFGWRIVEVKSSASVKSYHLDDAAIQFFVATRAGAPIESISVAHIDSAWTYTVSGDLRGLLKEVDVTRDAIKKEKDVEGWITQAKTILSYQNPPLKSVGPQCQDPYPCAFFEHCCSERKAAHRPVAWLPGRLRDSAVAYLEGDALSTEMDAIPEQFLTTQQRLVHRVTLSGVPFFDRKEALSSLSGLSLPAYFLDFETISFAVPRWIGTRPYQKIPFQFSVHCLSSDGSVTHDSYLDLSGDDPTFSIAEALVRACGSVGPVYVYNAGLERTALKYLSFRCPAMSSALEGISDRIVDLMPITKKSYYHFLQEGSWSLKAIIPTLSPELSYIGLEGIRDGALAMIGYLEAISLETPSVRKTEIETQLLNYCALDTLSLLVLRAFLLGESIDKLSKANFSKRKKVP